MMCLKIIAIDSFNLMAHHYLDFIAGYMQDPEKDFHKPVRILDFSYSLDELLDFDIVDFSFDSFTYHFNFEPLQAVRLDLHHICSK